MTIFITSLLQIGNVLSSSAEKGFSIILEWRLSSYDSMEKDTELN